MRHETQFRTNSPAKWQYRKDIHHSPTVVNSHRAPSHLMFAG